MSTLKPLEHLDPARFDTQAILKKLASSSRQLAELKAALFDYKHRIRGGYKFYSQDLINNLFMHPYTKIEFVQRDLQVSRLTATKYLEALMDGGFLGKQKVGRSNYYVNTALNGILLAQHRPPAGVISGLSNINS